MTDRTAQNFISVAERMDGKYETVSHLAPTVLYALAAPSTPDEIVEEVTTRASDGETFTASAATEARLTRFTAAGST